VGNREAADVFRAVADPTRRAILNLLRDTELSAEALGRPFRVSQPAISQHLRVLRRAGLVRGQKSGRRCVYRLNPKPLDELYEWVAQFREIADPAGHIWRIAARRPHGNPGSQTE
jgi:DNA-binding transcriptional ArsR family regulator